MTYRYVLDWKDEEWALTIILPLDSTPTILRLDGGGRVRWNRADPYLDLRKAKRIGFAWADSLLRTGLERLVALLAEDREATDDTDGGS